MLAVPQSLVIISTLLYNIQLCTSEYIPPGPRYTCPGSERAPLIHPCVCEKGTDDGLYIHCNNVGLATLSVGLGNVASLGMPIEKLVIKECQIANLFGPLLYRSSIRILRIEDTPIESIDEYTFLGVNRTLQELHLIHTKLQTFPKQAFRVLGNLTHLIIDGHEITKLDKDTFAESLMPTRLERLHIVNGLLTEIPVEPFQALKKLKTVDFHGNRITVLKKSQFKGLRDAEVLDLSFNNITKLDGAHIGDLTKLTWCNVSNNNIGQITRGMFARNAVLKVLHLNANKLDRLDTNSFRGMRFLRRLYLQDNQISDVGRGTFGTITRIGTIDLARNKIKKIDFQMFYQLNYVEILDLSENEITEIQKLSFKDLYLTHINISRNALAKIEPGAFENCANMTVLDLSWNNLTTIPRMAFDVNTYATEFQLSYNGFTELNQVPVHNMTGLKVLNVSHNALRSIPKGTFPKLYELHTVDVAYNEITDIHASVFQTLFSLRLLNLSHNALEIIKPSTFGTLPTLLALDLSHNALREISKGSLAKLASCRRLDVSHNQLNKIFQLPISLGELDFSHNQLSEIKEKIWPSMNALLSLNVAHNNLSDNLYSESFRSLLTLQTLDLSNNGITRPPWEALSSLSSLQYLYLKHNNLTYLNKAAFGRLPIVFELDLSGNTITEVSERAFDGLLQLLTLTLSNNGLKKIPTEAFKGLVSLRTLDLSNNKLEKLDNKTHGVLDDCLSLERVNLSYNRISFLTRKMFPSNPWIPYKLSAVDLSHNAMPVLTYDITQGTKRVQVLNVSYNNINDIRKDVLGNLTSLEILDLSGNSLTDLNSQSADSILKLPQNLTVLKLANNNLKTLPTRQLVNATKLKLLDVRENNLNAYDRELVNKVKNEGLDILFGGNPLTCDCFSRPLKHYIARLSNKLKDDPKFSNLVCDEPLALSGQNFTRVSDDRLVCAENVGFRQKIEGSVGAFDFEIEPDLAFRDVKFSQTSIHLQWYVLSSQDVADFSVIVRDEKNNLLYIHDVSYNKRDHTIDITKTELSELQKNLFDPNTTLELCVLAKKSNGLISNWFSSQCKTLPQNFSALSKKLRINTDTAGRDFLEKRKYSRMHSTAFSNALVLVSDSIMLTFCMFLSVCLRTMYTQ